jgi:hypothetical protein
MDQRMPGAGIGSVLMSNPQHKTPPHDQLDHYVDPPNNLIWIDMEGNAHFDIPGFLRMVGLTDTPANRAAAKETIKESIRKIYPYSTIVERERPD